MIFVRPLLHGLETTVAGSAVNTPWRGWLLAPPNQEPRLVDEAELPRTPSACTLVVPLAWMSWHRVRLSAAVLRSRRAAAYLRSALEERLLRDAQDASAVALAVEPQISSKARVSGDTEIWVCCIDANLMREALATLERMQLLVEAAIPEAAPQQDIQWQVRDCDGVPTFLACGPFGVLAQPLVGDEQVIRDLLSTLESLGVARQRLYEPGLSRDAALLGETATPVTTRQLWQASADLGWNLLQFEFAGGRNNLKRRIMRIVGDHMPWGAVAALVLVNTVGLGVLAWQTSAELDAVRKQIRATAMQALPPNTPLLNPVIQLRQRSAAAWGAHVASALHEWGKHNLEPPSAIALDKDRLVMQVSAQQVSLAPKTLGCWQLISAQGLRLEYRCAEGVEVQ